MQGWVVAAGAVLALGVAGGALAQGDAIAERRAGLREMGQQMEAIAGIVQGRGDQRQIAARVDQMTPFFQRLPNLVPTNTLTPPVAQGTNPGQTRALAAIEANRAGFQTASANMLTQLGTLKSAAEAGNVTPDLLRQTGATCGACHQNFRAR
jgi:cytochrome c556